MMSPTIFAATDAKSLRHWLLEQVCPFWAARIVDPRGGFFEGLHASGEVAASGRRSVLNQARLTYVFSHAHVLGQAPAMREAAAHGFAQLQRWQATADGGWPRARSSEGECIDAACDAYDHAFVIFAAAWHYSATQNADAIRMADAAFDFMHRHLADGRGGGFFEEYPDTARLPRRQNPHMHLLEATLAMFFATHEAKWLARSRALVELFEEHFFNRASGSLGEFFKADWAPADAPAGDLREPGHQFEWVWLLAQYRRASGERRGQTLADQLFKFGNTFGRDLKEPLQGMAFDGLDRGGGVTAETKLFWPQTEFIKACVARVDAGQSAAMEDIDTHLGGLRAHYFRPDGANWCNQLTRSGEPLVDVTPARVLYHLFLAVAEVVRVKVCTELGDARRDNGCDQSVGAP